MGQVPNGNGCTTEAVRREMQYSQEYIKRLSKAHTGIDDAVDQIQ
jgi:hypothetical protein